VHLSYTQNTFGNIKRTSPLTGRCFQVFGILIF
jgi:hypothetical protein